MKSISVSGLVLLLTTATLASPLQAQEPSPPLRRIGLGYSTAHFKGELSPWHLAALELSQRGSAGTLLVRGTLARRFEQTGEQVEVEAYPVLGEKAYAHLNGGYSPSGLFPDWRYGAELFLTAAPGVEISAGARRLEFDAEAVSILTGSAALYAGRYYLAARPYVTPRDEELLFSGSLMARRYLADESDWLGLTIGGGEAIPDDVSAFELLRLRSYQAQLEGRHGIGRDLAARWSLGGEHEELPNHRERRRITLGVGLEASF